MISRLTSLSARIVDFSRFLRSKGYDISPDREAIAMLAAEDYLESKESFRQALKGVFPTNRTTFLQFESHFDQYFKELEKAVDSKIAEQEKKSDSQPKKNNQEAETAFKSLKNWLKGNTEDEESLAAYGGDTRLENKDFSSYTDDDLKDSERLIQVLLRRLNRKPGRRKKRVKHADKVDLQATIRRNLREGTEIKNLIFTQKKPAPVRIVLITDVSRSMEVYSRFFVQFMYAFEKIYPQIQTFVFSSQLHKISEEFKGKDFKKVLERLAQRTPYWSGGTQIGASLHSFVNKHFYQRVDPKTIVMIVSDGLDTGDAIEVSQAMKKIKKRVKKVVWINPLAGHTAYQPTAAAMHAALPFIDIFASGHNFLSLKKLMLKITT